ncbi:MAG: GAF domain-containing protein [Pseudomonadota bacterium]
MTHPSVDYELLLAQAKAVTDNEPNALANLANVAALLFDALHAVNWAGFYLLRDGELVLGPFQGKSACVRIPVGSGVCGTAVAQDRIQLVDDVHAFDGHIACDANSMSEIVLPIRRDGAVIGVLDIDSPIHARFSDEDAQGLVPIATLVSEIIGRESRSIGI